MNPIYRVWDKKEQCWKVNVQVDFSGVLWWQYGDSLTPIEDQERYSVQLSAHLKDKNGKEIYEGDILMYRNNMSIKNPGVPFDSYHKVCFGGYDFGDYEDQEDGYGWYRQDIGVENDGSSLTPISSDLYEVAGNIYENPELLK